MRLTTLLFAIAISVSATASPCDHPFVIRRGGDTSACANSAQIHRLAGRDDVFWFEHDGVSYIVTDAATLDRIEALFEPQRALGHQQSELGRQQSELGRQQSALGRQQSALGREQRGADSERQRELSRQQSDLSAQQAALGRQQAALGEQQAELGRKQSALARETDRKLGAIEEDLIRNGTARRE